MKISEILIIIISIIICLIYYCQDIVTVLENMTKSMAE